MIGAVLFEQNDVYGSPPSCKVFQGTATNLVLAVVYPALQRGIVTAGPDGVRGSAAGQLDGLTWARIISLAFAEPGQTGSPSSLVSNASSVAAAIAAYRQNQACRSALPRSATEGKTDGNPPIFSGVLS